MNSTASWISSPEVLLLAVLLLAVGVVVWLSLRGRGKKPGEDAYTEALEALVDGNLRLAVQKLKEAVRENSSNIKAYLILGNVLRERGMHGHALRIHRELTLRESLTPQQRAEVQRALMYDYAAAGDIERAIQSGHRFLEETKSVGRDDLLFLLSLYEKKENWSGALELSKKYSKVLGPAFRKRQALYLVFQGNQLVAQGHDKEGRVKFKEALKLDPDCVAATYYLGKSYLEADRLEEAAQVWRQLCEKHPEKAYLVFAELEKVWYELGRFNDAEQLYTRLMQQNAGKDRAALALARIYSKKGEYDSALEILEQAQNGAPTPETMALRLQVLWNKNQYKQAASQAMEFFEKQAMQAQKNFVCQKCGFVTTEPAWRCPQCGAIDSFAL
ncbi:MAG: hypothetical protein D6715_06310 [Calditrichaeota bacterium]|nr:MAG: hypothetical protein D6715_06310 [Calditrichota bacterium]